MSWLILQNKKMNKLICDIEALITIENIKIFDDLHYKVVNAQRLSSEEEKFYKMFRDLREYLTNYAGNGGEEIK